MMPIPPSSLTESAYRKAYERGLAASDPARMITVNVSGVPATANTPAVRPISFSTRQDISMSNLLAEIHRRLPEMQHPFTISTVGANPRGLAIEMDAQAMELLQPWDATSLTLRVNVRDPHKPDKQQKKSLGARLRKALGANNDRLQDARNLPSSDITGAASSRSSMRSAPPPYEETARPSP